MEQNNHTNEPRIFALHQLIVEHQETHPPLYLWDAEDDVPGGLLSLLCMDSLPQRADEMQAKAEHDELQADLDDQYFENQEQSPEYQADIWFDAEFSGLMTQIHSYNNEERLYDLIFQNPVLQFAMGMV